jgi:hypothetical protein
VRLDLKLFAIPFDGVKGAANNSVHWQLTLYCAHGAKWTHFIAASMFSRAAVVFEWEMAVAIVLCRLAAARGAGSSSASSSRSAGRTGHDRRTRRDHGAALPHRVRA